MAKSKPENYYEHARIIAAVISDIGEDLGKQIKDSLTARYEKDNMQLHTRILLNIIQAEQASLELHTARLIKVCERKA